MSAEMGKGRHVVIHDVYGDTTKWATDQSAIRTRPCKYSMHQYSILLQILGNWLITEECVSVSESDSVGGLPLLHRLSMVLKNHPLNRRSCDAAKCDSS